MAIKISLRVLTFIIITVVVMFSTIIAFVPTYLTGLDSIRSGIKDVGRVTARRAQERCANFFMPPIDGVDNVFRLNKQSLIDFYAPNTWRWLCDAARNSASCVTALHLVVPNTFSICDCSVGTTYVGLTINGTLYRTSVDPVTGDMNTSMPLPSVVPPFQRNILAAITSQPTHQGLMLDPSLNVGWIPGITYGFNSAQLTAVTRLVNPVTGAFEGHFRYDMTASRLGIFLADVGLRRRGRAVLIEMTSKVVIGNSFSEPVEIYLIQNYTNRGIPGPQRMFLKKLPNITDSLIRETWARYNDFLHNVPTPYETTMVDSSQNNVYLYILDVTDGMGLQLRLVVCTPEIDYTETIIKQRTITVSILVCGIVCLVIIGIVLIHLSLRPLKRLEERMNNAASLQDETEDSNETLISEVHSMQYAFDELQAELLKIKTYLPKTLFASNNDDDNETETESFNEQSVRSSNAGRTPPDLPLDARSVKSNAIPEINRSLNLVNSCTVRKVAIMVFNLCKFESETDIMKMQSLQSKTLEIVERVSNSHRGVLDTYNGDHIFISFGACSNVASPSIKAAHSAFAARSEIESVGYNCSVGIATSSAKVGNMGTAATKRMNIIGPAYTDAIRLERLCRAKNVWNLVTSSVSKEIEYEYYFENVDIIMITKPRIISTMIAAKSGGPSDEWMYELRNSDNKDVRKQWNKIFETYLAGDMEFINSYSPPEQNITELESEIIAKLKAVSSEEYAIMRTRELAYTQNL